MAFRLRAARSCARLIWVRPKSRPASCRNWRRPLAEKNSSPDGSRALLEHGAKQIPGKIRSGFRLRAQMPAKRLNFPAIIPRGSHPFPSRTRKLSPAGPIVLYAKVCGRVGRRRIKIKALFRNEWSLFLFGWVRAKTIPQITLIELIAADLLLSLSS